MGNTDGFTLAPLGPDAIGAAMALVEEAGWNQIPADWAIMGRLGDTVAIRDADGTLVASALALPYRPGFGWISMVLVAGAMRRRGLATRLLADRITWLRERGLVPVLDATEAGEPVYSKLGFTRGERFTRWQGEGGDVAAPDTVRPAGTGDREWMTALDATVFGVDRSALLGDFLDRPGSAAFVTAGGETGFVIARRGRRATQLGPLIAANEAEAIDLLDAALAATPGPVFFDAHDGRGALGAHILSRGFTRQRGFVRMSLGAIGDFNGGGRSMVIAGPEYG